MKLSDKDALLLCVQALPTADIWHEISQDRMIEIYQQAARELARLESIELSSGLTSRAPDEAYWACEKCNSIVSVKFDVCGLCKSPRR